MAQIVTPQMLAAAQDVLVNQCMPSPYTPWYAGYVSYGDEAPAWAVNAPPPDPALIRQYGAFCAFVPTWMHRYCGLTIPAINGDEYNDGGIYSYYEEWYSSSEWFNVNAQYPNGTFVMAPYIGPALDMQGHVAMVWWWQGVQYAVEWIWNPGGTWNFTLQESHNGWGEYVIAIRPEVWVPFAGGVWQDTDAPAPVDPVTPSAPDDAALAAAIDPYLDGHGKIVVDAARARGLDLEIACGYVERESEGKNIFGCDHGDVGDTPPYCQQEVTYERVQALRDGGNYSYGMNGVGLPQITWWTLIEEAEALGGAHLPENQCLVGFKVMKSYVDKYGLLEGLGAYNTGSPAVTDYSYDVSAKIDAWRDYLAKVQPTQPDGGDVQYSIYTWVAAWDDKTSRDLADAGYMTLQDFDVDSLVFNEQQNILDASRYINAINDVTKYNLLVVGQQTKEQIDPEAKKRLAWADNNPIWDLGAASDLDTLIRVRNWALGWITAHLPDGEHVTTEDVFSRFNAYLLVRDKEKYKQLIADADKHEDPNPPAPPQTLEQRVEILEREVKQLVEEVNGK